jgi:hypothetical protein
MNRIALASTAGIVVAGLAALTGCSSSPAPAAARPAATVTVTAAATAATAATAPATSTAPAGTAPAAAPTPAATRTAAPATPPPATPPPSAGPVPTLGQPAGVVAHGAGFGLIRPSRIFNGGDPTGLVTGVAWTSWGGASATGTGASEYVGPGQSVAAGRGEAAAVVAFDLGTCDGKLMYRAVEWYFPQHGQSFRPGRYEDICTGSYVPAG